MKTMRRFLSVALSALFLVTLAAGCGDQGESSTDGEGGNTYEITMTSFDNASTVAC